jgi:uncharacterized membrane protein HdeD (DUF308 family)
MPKDIANDHVSSEEFPENNHGDDGGSTQHLISTREMSNYWAAFFFRGLLVTGFGLYFIIKPASSIEVLVKVFGSLFILEGAVNAFKALYVICYTPTFDMLGMYLFYFAVNVGIGIFIIAHPDTTTAFFLGVLAAYFLIVGILQCLFATVLRSSSDMSAGTEFFLALTGGLYMLLGIVVFTNIDSTSNLLMRIVGVLLTLSGIQLLMMGTNLRNASLEEDADNDPAADPTRTELSSLV